MDTLIDSPRTDSSPRITTVLKDLWDKDRTAIVEASTLRWPPGHWPKHIIVSTPDGPGTVLNRDPLPGHWEGELVSVDYTGPYGRKLTVLND